jgi:ribonuclease Z
MCEDASLLVHECTNAAIPEKIGRGDKGRKTQVQGLTPSLVEKMNRQGQAVGGGNGGPSHEPLVGPWGSQVGDQPGLTEKDETKRVEVRKKAEGRGHATPKEVGEFAQAIRARRVVVNHFSAM